ncbi:Pol protein [Phytophthora palmivora]|uniref:Pol protein n=1 Tax=Phytophthora palmivora TaxID=4796 RepID=A0A2P4X032_9STRA|nr:Pol protein [Phytophthora palmivora]
MASARDRQKGYSHKNGRGKLAVIIVGDLVHLDTKNLLLTLVSSVGSNKLKHHFNGPVGDLGRHGAAYTVDLRKSFAFALTSNDVSVLPFGLAVFGSGFASFVFVGAEVPLELPLRGRREHRKDEIATCLELRESREPHASSSKALV